MNLPTRLPWILLKLGIEEFPSLKTLIGKNQRLNNVFMGCVGKVKFMDTGKLANEVSIVLNMSEFSWN